tara:strand:+ start:266 stop:835 length:570 start_codon:yes stop_codon:yes gene_type:complete
LQSSLDLFAPPTPESIAIAPDAWLLKGFAHAQADDLLAQIGKIEQQAAFRHQVTPGGHAMSSAQCSCGTYGWITDKHGYRYTTEDPLTDKPWPAMPSSFRELAVRAAAEVGFEGFDPQSCLINRYQTGAGMGLHQDKDEQDLGAPIVSVTLGAPITFLFGGVLRTDKPSRWLLEHGDVVVCKRSINPTL